jgi:hypothetical protein
MYLVCFSRTILQHGASLPCSGSASSRVPRPPRYYEGTTTSWLEYRLTYGFARPAPMSIRQVRSATASDPTVRPGPAQARYHWLSLIGRYSGSPRFLDNPFHAFAPLCDPGQPDRTHPSAPPAPPPPNRKRRHPALKISGLNHAASASAAYASTRTVTRLAQGSLPAGG